MSNCIRPVGAFADHGVLLDPSMFNTIPPSKDTDRNEITIEKDGAVLRMGSMTTWREWRNFIWDHVQPYVKVANVRIPTLLSDEYDSFETDFKSEIRLFPPGTLRDNASEAFRDQWSEITG